MKFIATRLAVAGLAAILGTSSAMAQTAKFTLLDIQGLVVGKTMTIDKAYGATHGVTIPAPFSFLVPTDPALAIYVEDPSPEHATFIKISFATLDEKLVENVQFVPMTIGLGDRTERINALAALLTKQAYPMAIATYPENKFIGWREVTVAGLDGVEVLGEYLDPQWGHMYLRVVGILNPDSPDSIFAVSNISASQIPISDASEFPRTRSGVAIEKFEYLD